MNIKEFFNDVSGTPSISRALLAGSFIVASGIMGYLTVQEKMTEGYLALYLGTFAGSYAVGKSLESRNAVKSPTDPKP